MHPQKVIIIGNGFDLNLGLETGYKHFLKSDHFSDLLEDKNSLAEYLFGKYQKANWIDIENELKVFSRSTDKDFLKEFERLSGALVNYLSWVDTNKINKDSAAYSLILDNFKSDVLILDFNYTDTVEKILLSLGVTKDELPRKLIKVHGSLKEEDTIFGVEDKASIQKGHIFLKKSYPKHYKAVDVHSYIGICQSVHFFGHSLGETDHHYFKDFFLSNTQGSLRGYKINIHLYHHGNTGYRNLLEQIDVLTNQDVKLLKQFSNLNFIDSTVNRF